jgi:hypothetical protein
MTDHTLGIKGKRSIQFHKENILRLCEELK